MVRKEGLGGGADRKYLLPQGKLEGITASCTLWVGMLGAQSSTKKKASGFGSGLEQTVSKPVLLLLFCLFYYKVMHAYCGKNA